MLLDGIANKKFSCVCVRKRDRLFRNTLLSLRFYEYLNRHDCTLMATDENLPAATDGTGKFTLTVLAAAAELELEKIRDNVLRAKEYARRHGHKLGPVQLLGYRDADPTKAEPKGTVIVDDKTRAIALEIFERLVGGMSGYQLVQWLEENHPRHESLKHLTNTLLKHGHWHLSSLTRMLRNPRYIGLDEVDGKLVPSRHYTAITPADLFWKAQKVLDARTGCYIRRTPRDQEQPHLLSGLLKCGAHGNNLACMKRKYDGQCFYYCLARHDHKQLTILEPSWIEWVRSFFAPEFLIDRYSPPDPRESLYRIKVDRIEKNLTRLKHRFAAAEIDADLYVSAAQLAKGEMARLNDELKALPPIRGARHTPWEDMNFDERREVLKHMIDHVDVFADHAVVHFQPGTNRPPQTFPFMKRNRRHAVHVRATTCLTPCLLAPRDAWAVETADMRGVNWQPYVEPGEFYYVNPAHANVAPPNGYGQHCGMTPGGWVKEEPRRTFADAIADQLAQSEVLATTVGDRRTSTSRLTSVAA